MAKRIRGVMFEENLKNSMGLEFYNLSHRFGYQSPNWPYFEDVKIERIHYHVDRGIKTERGRRRFNIVVDRFRYADAVDAGFLQLLRGHQRTVATNDDQRPYAEVFQNLPGICNDVRRNDCAVPCTDFCNEMTAISGTKNRPAQRHDPVYSLPVENDVIARR